MHEKAVFYTRWESNVRQKGGTWIVLSIRIWFGDSPPCIFSLLHAHIVGSRSARRPLYQIRLEVFTSDHLSLHHFFCLFFCLGPAVD